MTQHLLSLLMFAVAGAFTPGPNNMISAGSGAAFGFRRTLPQMWGVAFGYAFMVAAVGLGLGGLFTAVPFLHPAMKIAGAAYLLYLAWKIAHASGPGGAGAMEKPPTLVQSALFQWINPKAWTLALSVVPAFTTVGGDLVTEVLVISVVMGAVSFPALALWAGFGALLARTLSEPRQQRIVNYIMAALVASSVVMLFI